MTINTDKLASRKLWSLIFTILIVMFNNKLGLGLTPEMIDNLVKAEMAYLVGQGIADMKK